MKALMQELARAARAAAPVLASASCEQKDRALRAAATAIRRDASKILAANAQDTRTAEERGLSAALLDRLRL
ncbi:MAG: gamma-glutamyl-phosphate reductase, partial [Gammaproteobacteria bacterium]|nr:gamma-glutamyl-phosphate reductase [Gammaproteobacteria bacterium]